jgi:hypothetical protein
MLPVSLDCPFLIAPSVFSNVFWYIPHILFDLSFTCIGISFHQYSLQWLKYSHYMEINDFKFKCSTNIIQLSVRIEKSRKNMLTALHIKTSFGLCPVTKTSLMPTVKIISEKKYRVKKSR